MLRVILLLSVVLLASCGQSDSSVVACREYVDYAALTYARPCTRP